MDAERVRAQVGRILASAAFAGADRASNFLRFVVERKLEGRAGEIKEFVIAVEVLGRTPRLIQKLTRSFALRLAACATGSVPTTKTKAKQTSS